MGALLYPCEEAPPRVAHMFRIVNWNSELKFAIISSMTWHRCHAQSLFPKKTLESSLWTHIPISINIEQSLKAVTWPDHLLIIRPKGHPTRDMVQFRTLSRPLVQFPLMHFNFLWHVTNHKTIIATRDAMQVTRHVTWHMTLQTKMTLPQQCYSVEAVHHHGNQKGCTIAVVICKLCAAMLSCAKSRYKS